MKNALLLFALLFAGCDQPTPTQKAADQFFKKAETQLLINCRDRYDLADLRATYDSLRQEQPDSALSWAARLYISAKVGDCPK